MFSKQAASRIFASLAHQHDILLWRYATSESALQKKVLGLKMLALKLRQSFAGAFYGAVLEAGASGALRNAIVNARALGPEQAVRRAILMRNTIEKWETAKSHGNFGIVAQSLDELVGSVREEARAKARMLGVSSPYEALLQSRTPGFSMAVFEGWVCDLEDFCRKAAHRLAAGSRAGREFPLAQKTQEKLQNDLLAALGFNFSRGRIKRAAHPICLGMHDDVRIGMRIDAHDAAASVLTVMHEGGHALYRQGLPCGDGGTESGIAGIGADEAMALLMENHVARSEQFVNFLTGLLPDIYKSDEAGLRARIQCVKTGQPIRTEADEVHYPLHVILRYRIEKAMIDGDMAAADIPAFWAAEFERMTGTKIERDADGALQDIHWYGGEFAWFPNYLIGQLAAAQLYEAAVAKEPNIPDAIKRGNFKPLRNWLESNVYKHGANLTIFEIVEKATGEKLGTDSYKRHIEERYFKPPRAPLILPFPCRP